MAAEEGEVECAVCGERGDDRRHLILKCGYDLSEGTDKLELDDTGFYAVFVCKRCRGDFIMALWSWLRGEFIEPEERGGPDVTVGVRGNKYHARCADCDFESGGCDTPAQAQQIADDHVCVHEEGDEVNAQA